MIVKVIKACAMLCVYRISVIKKNGISSLYHPYSLHQPNPIIWNFSLVIRTCSLLA